MQSQANIFDTQGKPLPDQALNSSEVSWRLIEARENKFAGVGLLTYQFDGGTGSCTASLIKMTDTPDANTPAYIITAAHCVPIEHLKKAATSNIILENIPVSRMAFRPHYTVDGAFHTPIYGVKKLIYANYVGLDVAVFELKNRLVNLERRGFTARRIRSAVFGESVALLGIPGASSVFTDLKVDQKYLRISECHIDGLIENQGWQARNMDIPIKRNLRQALLHKCSSMSGSSGGPLISLQSDEIVAINSSETRDALNWNIAHNLTEFLGCFTSKGIFNLSLSSCLAERACDPKIYGQEFCQGFLEVKCEQNAPWACEEIGKTMQADQYLEKACRLNSAESCSILALQKSKALPEEVQAATAIALYTKPCALGDAQSCFMLGLIHYFDTKPDLKQAWKFFDGSCEMGDHLGCYMVAEGFKWKLNAQVKRMKYYKVACNQGIKKACTRIQEITNGKLPPIDHGKAIELPF